VAPSAPCRFVSRVGRLGLFTGGWAGVKRRQLAPRWPRRSARLIGSHARAGSSVGTSVRLKSGRSAVRSRPCPPLCQARCGRLRHPTGRAFQLTVSIWRSGLRSSSCSCQKRELSCRRARRRSKRQLIGPDRSPRSNSDGTHTVKTRRNTPCNHLTGSLCALHVHGRLRDGRLGRGTGLGDQSHPLSRT
jgi:hypothetical protein